MCLCLVVSIVKYILIVINVKLTFGGLAIAALGVFILLELRSIENAELGDLNLLPILTIVAGCVITVIFLLGCCGAVTKNKCMLITYSIVIVILASLTVGFTLFLSKNTTSITDMANEQVTEMINGTDDTILHSLEHFLECCGTTGPDSYSNTSLPITCCPQDLANIQNIQQNIDFSSISTAININTNELCSINDAFKEGCLTKFTNTLKDILDLVNLILIFICIIEYVAAAMAIILTCFIKRRK